MTFFYWIAYRGRVTAKEVEERSVLGDSLRSFVVSMGTRDYSVSEADYKRVSVGDVVELEYNESGQLAQITKIETLRGTIK